MKTRMINDVMSDRLIADYYTVRRFGITQDKLAKEFNTTVSSISRAINGNIDRPYQKELQPKLQTYFQNVKETQGLK